MRRNGLSATELLTVVAIVLSLAALSIPAVQAARETVRRLQCASNMRQIALAAQLFEESQGVVVPAHNERLGWLGILSPYHEYGPEIPDDFSMLEQGSNTGPAVVGAFVCPSDSSGRVALAPELSPTSYAGNAGTGWWWHGYNGMLQPHRAMRANRGAMPDHGRHGGPLQSSDVSDGLSQTALIAEILVSDNSDHLLRANWNTRGAYLGVNDYERFAAICEGQAFQISPTGLVAGNRFSRGRPWWSGGMGITAYNHYLPPNRPSCLNGTGGFEGAYTAAALHPAGVNVAFADGRITYFTSSVNLSVWRAIGSRDGGEQPRS